jgi:hypothetical protein
LIDRCVIPFNIERYLDWEWEEKRGDGLGEGEEEENRRRGGIEEKSIRYNNNIIIVYV